MPRSGGTALGALALSPALPGVSAFSDLFGTLPQKAAFGEKVLLIRN